MFLGFVFMELSTTLTVTSYMCEAIHKPTFIDIYLLVDSVVHTECPKSDSKGYKWFFCSTASGFWLKNLHLQQQWDSLSSAAGRIAIGNIGLDWESGAVGPFHCTTHSAEPQLLKLVWQPLIFFLENQSFLLES